MRRTTRNHKDIILQSQLVQSMKRYKTNIFPDTVRAVTDLCELNRGDYFPEEGVHF